MKEGEKVRRIQLKEPARCIAAGKDGLLYLGITEHVEVYDRADTRKAIWSSLGSGAVITSIAVAGSEVYVADAGNRMVMRFDKSGKLLGFIEGKEEAQGRSGFIIPGPYFDVAIGKDETIWVGHTGRFSLENYTPAGMLLWAWGSSSESIEGFCGCCNPTHIAILSDGTFVTSEKGIPRVKVYDPTGGFMCIVAGPEHFKEGTVGLDLAVDDRDRILVLDPKDRAVRIFVKK